MMRLERIFSLNAEKAHRMGISAAFLIGAILSISSFIPVAAYQGDGLSRLVQTPRLKPPAPGPRHLSPRDYRELKYILEAISRRNWSGVRAAIPRIEDPQAKSLGEWYYFDARDPNVSITDGAAFLDNHPDWPSLNRIQTHLESKLTNNTPSSIVYDLFSNRNPITGNGKIQFIRALIDRGDREAADIYVQDSWTTHRFTSSQERTILARYARALSPRHHIDRVDNLLWARQVTSARRTFSRLPAGERRKAEARAALYVRAGSAERLFNGLPDADRNDPGVLHAAIRYYRRSDKEDRAISLARALPDDPALLRNPSRFWNERNLLMRWALRNGRFSDAYAMASATGLEDGLDLADAEFNAGWVALRFLQEPERAEKHFLSLASWATSPISTARAYYWLGRAARAKGDKELARTRFNVAAQYIYTYYGQLAAEEVGGVLVDQKFVTTAVLTDADRIKFDARPTALAFRMISDLNHRRSLLRFSYNLDDMLETPGEFLLLSEITTGEQAPHLTIRAGKTAVRKQTLIPEVSYPLIQVPEEASRFVTPELILGLSRQESEFNPAAYSSAGARGMMQLLPSTAQITARKERIAYSRGALLSDPSYNMIIGSAHLSHLIDRFDGSWIMTFVGYNAGPHRATRWVSEYGDPRSISVDPVDWVELIPFSETRNYVQRVLENTQIYRARLTGGSIAGQLTSDLERGGRPDRAAKVKQPSSHLASLRPDSDDRPLPPLSSLTQTRIRQAPLNLPAARPSAGHLIVHGSTETPSAVSDTTETSPTTPAPPNDAEDQAPASTSLAAPQTAPIEKNTTSQVQTAPPSTTQETIPPAPATKPRRTPEPTQEAKPSKTTTKSPENPPSIKSRRKEKKEFDPYTAAIPGETSHQQSNASQETQVDSNTEEECRSYRGFVAANTENKNESAEDLNAAMLAELRGGNGCAEKTEEQNETDNNGNAG